MNKNGSKSCHLTIWASKKNKWILSFFRLFPTFIFQFRCNSDKKKCVLYISYSILLSRTQKTRFEVPDPSLLFTTTYYWCNTTKKRSHNSTCIPRDDECESNLPLKQYNLTKTSRCNPQWDLKCGRSAIWKCRPNCLMRWFANEV